MVVLLPAAMCLGRTCAPTLLPASPADRRALPCPAPTPHFYFADDRLLAAGPLRCLRAYNGPLETAVVRHRVLVNVAQVRSLLTIATNGGTGYR